MRRRSATIGPSATTANTIVIVSSTLPFNMRFERSPAAPGVPVELLPIRVG